MSRMHRARRLLVAVGVVAACSAASDDETKSSPGPAPAEVVVEKLQAARRSQADNDARMLLSAAQMYVMQTEECPADVQALAARGVIAKVLRDPWEKDYVLECRDKGASVLVVSLGPDGQRGTADDIVSETHEF